MWVPAPRRSGILAYEIPIIALFALIFDVRIFLKDLLKTEGINLTTEKALSGYWFRCRTKST
jgi:hypothetical protein